MGGEKIQEEKPKENLSSGVTRKDTPCLGRFRDAIVVVMLYDVDLAHDSILPPILFPLILSALSPSLFLFPSCMPLGK